MPASFQRFDDTTTALRLGWAHSRFLMQKPEYRTTSHPHTSFTLRAGMCNDSAMGSDLRRRNRRTLSPSVVQVALGRQMRVGKIEKVMCGALREMSRHRRTANGYVRSSRRCAVLARAQPTRNRDHSVGRRPRPVRCSARKLSHTRYSLSRTRHRSRAAHTRFTAASRVGGGPPTHYRRAYPLGFFECQFQALRIIVSGSLCFASQPRSFFASEGSA